MMQAFRAFFSHDGRIAPRAPLARLKLVRRFAQGNDGMTTVEFGLVALPFLALLFAILETTMIFFASQTLETAVADAARLVLTGQAQSQGFAPSDFRTAVCARVHGLLDCQNGLQIDVRTYASFSAINNAPPVDTHGNLQTSSFGYTPGSACDIVVVRLMYQWPVYISMLGLDRLANLNGSMRLIMATAAFRNEPYGSVSC